MKFLRDLLPEADASNIAQTAISSLAFDSRKASPGALFFAVPGAKADGAAFIAQALAQGAAAAVTEADGFSENSRVVTVKNVRLALAMAASRFYPQQPATIAAVTGTSGKTSVAAFLRQIWAHCGRRAASLGTIGVVGPDGAAYGSLTTPDPLTLHETLDRLARENVTHLAMEASSHGLDQFRLDGVRLTAGAFTNLSQDHLDYHPNIESYFVAKLGLFARLLQAGQSAVIDADSDVAAGVAVCARTQGLNVVTVGRRGETIRLIDSRAENFRTQLTLEYHGRRSAVTLPLAGAFQGANALVAAGLALSCGEPADKVFAALETLQGAPGRLDFVGGANGGAAYVDYAHKPGALETALEAMRPFAKGRLIVVFGCGGDRDRGKRPLMGAIAARLADIAIITDDNPRSENPDDIRAQILAGARDANKGDVREIGERAEAIAAGVALMEPGDILLVAGKGHETGQIVGSRILPFSDHDHVRAALLAAGGELQGLSDPH